MSPSSDNYHVISHTSNYGLDAFLPDTDKESWTCIDVSLKMAQTTETAVPQQSNGRKLRSQEASRFKSDLSLFFSDYDEVIGNKPKKQGKS